MTDAEVVSQTVDDRVVVITGAANGIGWATARCFAARGCRVALIDRDGDGLQARSKELGADHEETIESASYLANALRDIGRLAASERHWRQVAAAQRFVFGCCVERQPCEQFLDARREKAGNA